MTDQAEIESATRRLSQALDMLDAAVERRIEIDRSRTHPRPSRCTRSTPTAPSSPPTSTRSSRKVRSLESANREIARRLDAAMENIRLVLESQPMRSSVSQVNVTINGRQFRMACEDGQEGHLQQLARELDERIVALRGQFGEIGDARLTVMAALMVADELAEAGKKLQAAGGGSRRPAGRPRHGCRARAGDAGGHRRRLQFGGRAHRRHGQEARPDRRRRRRASHRARFTAVFAAWLAVAAHPHYIARAGLRGASESHSPGPYDLEGSCPWPGPWFRSYGAHLLM